MENIVRAMACARCPLQGMPGLRELDETQIAYMQDFKDGEIVKCYYGDTNAMTVCCIGIDGKDYSD